MADDRLYSNLGGHHLRALNPATGATIWSVDGSQLAPVSSTGPAVANVVLYHGTGEGSGVLLARDPATSTVPWTDSTTIGRSTSAYNTVVVADGALYALPLHRYHRPPRLGGVAQGREVRPDGEIRGGGRRLSWRRLKGAPGGTRTHAPGSGGRCSIR